MRRWLLSVAPLLAAVLASWSSAWADPTFTISPNPALTGYENGNEQVNVVSFTYQEGPSQQEAWDLDGDGLFDDHYGPTASRTYPARGTVTIGLQVTDTSGGTTKVSTGYMPLQINGPATDFHVFPATPTTGQQVTFAYSPVDPVDPSTGIHWDLNGDGVFDDSAGATAIETFAVPGTYPVSLRVTDQTTGAVSTGMQPITVGPASPPARSTGGKPQLRLMSPFPIVRITGKVTGKGAVIKRLTIRAPFGSTVVITCRGHGCPFRRSSRTLALAGSKMPSRTVRVKKLERRLLRAGASLKVLVSRAGEIGKYTRFKIRKGKTPLRTDLCLLPGSNAPKECPSS